MLGEQARFLLTELIALYQSDGLLDNDDTVIVAAGTAWPEYAQLSAYVCQPDRSFRTDLTHFGFYTRGEIKPLVPRIQVGTHQSSSPGRALSVIGRMGTRGWLH